MSEPMLNKTTMASIELPQQTTSISVSSSSSSSQPYQPQQPQQQDQLYQQSPPQQQQLHLPYQSVTGMSDDHPIPSFNHTTNTITNNHHDNHNNNDKDNEDEEEENTDDLTDYPLVTRQIAEIWRTVQLRAVWRPMAFVYCFNLMQVKEQYNTVTIQ